MFVLKERFCLWRQWMPWETRPGWDVLESCSCILCAPAYVSTVTVSLPPDTESQPAFTEHLRLHHPHMTHALPLTLTLWQTVFLVNWIFSCWWRTLWEGYISWRHSPEKRSFDLGSVWCWKEALFWDKCFFWGRSACCFWAKTHYFQGFYMSRVVRNCRERAGNSFSNQIVSTSSERWAFFHTSKGSHVALLSNRWFSNTLENRMCCVKISMNSHCMCAAPGPLCSHLTKV